MGICGSTGAGDDGKPLNQPGRPRSDSLSRKELKPEPMGACGGCCRLFADAWRFDNFDFDLEGADWRHSFSSSRLFASSGTLLALRFFIAVGMTVVLALSMADYSHAAKLKFWPIYVSSWSNFLGMLYMWMTLVTHVLALSLPWPDPDRPNTRTPWFVSLTWLLYSVAVPFSAITVVLSLMGYTEGSNHKLGQVLLVHWASAALMGASVLLNNYSYHILHVTFPMLLAIAYLVFTYVYTSLGGLNPRGGHAVYHGFDWTSQEVGVQLPLTLLGGALVNGLVWLMVAYVRNLIDDDAWARIAAANSKWEDPEAAGANAKGKA